MSDKNLNYFERLSLKHEEEEAARSKHLTVENLRKVLNVRDIENLEYFNFDGCKVHPSDLILWAAKRIATLEEENSRLSESKK